MSIKLLKQFDMVKKMSQQMAGGGMKRGRMQMAQAKLSAGGEGGAGGGLAWWHAWIADEGFD